MKARHWTRPIPTFYPKIHRYVLLLVNCWSCRRLLQKHSAYIPFLRHLSHIRIPSQPPKFHVVHVDGVRLCLWTAATNGHINHPPGVVWVWEPRWNDTDRRNLRTRTKTYPSANSFITNSTWTGLGANPGLRIERPATNRLSHGSAPINFITLCSPL
jgi:hypothetical protein